MTVVTCLNLLNSDELRNLSNLKSHACLSLVLIAMLYFIVGTEEKDKEKRLL